MGLEIGRGLGQSGVRKLGSKWHVDGVRAVGGRHVQLVSVAAASRGTQGDGPREQAQYNHYRLCPLVDKLILK